MKVTLTFDNGPDAEATPGVLTELSKRGIPATFFVVGRQLVRPGGYALTERAHAEGHWIGNHTWSHGGPLGLNPAPDLAETEIRRTQDALGRLVEPRRLFRPVGGGGQLGRHLLRRRDVDHLARERMTCVLWNAVPGDWRDPDGWIATALEQCAARDWTLMVLHDLPTGAMRHLGRFLDVLVARGATFRQDFPPDRVPMEGGRITGTIDDFVMGEEASSDVARPSAR